MTRDQFIADHPIIEELERRGVTIIGSANQRKAKCPFHEDKAPSFSINVSSGIWKCHAGCGGGSVIDLIARFNNVEPGSLLKSDDKPAAPWKPPVIKPEPDPIGKIVKIYSYQNEFGAEVYQAVRLDPKDFRQRRQVDGKWMWNTTGIARVLYRLPEVMAAQTVAIAEGEKDVETLVSLGWCATCNVGGAGKWLDGYTDSLAGKDVIIFGDNDDPGQKHVKTVFEAVTGKARTVKLIKIPETYKDVSEYVESFTTTEEAKVVISGLILNAHPFVRGVSMPIYSMAGMEARYIEHAKNAQLDAVNLAKWLPSLKTIRPLVPGEVVLIIGDTGSGKTAVLQSLALATIPIPTVLFEIELPGELVYERFVAAKMGCAALEVEKTYADGEVIGEKALNVHFPNLFVCDDASLNLERLESMIIRSDLVLGCKPKLVLLDYVQLIGSEGNTRYDKASHASETIKRIAKRTRTVIVMASQRGRQPQGRDGKRRAEVSLFDGKESGSLENSSGVVLGVWRDKDDPMQLHMKVLKSTKGGSGTKLTCNFDGKTMRIKERYQRQIEEKDVPEPAQQREFNSAHNDP